MEIDDAFEAARRLLSDASERVSAIVSEADAKTQIITRVVTEVLGWSFSDLSNENPNENGFSDYLISDGKTASIVIEAKRIGKLEIDTTSTSKGYYKLNGPVLKPAIAGISQAASYCYPMGVQLAVLTDGISWVIFLPWVREESYLEKQAIVFPTISSILDDFPLFYELLAKPERRKGTYQVIFDRIHENRLILDKALTAPMSSFDNPIIQKSALAFDLEPVFAKFFSSLTGDDDPGMLIDCFVESKESRIADFALERITKNVLGNIDHDKDVGEGLQTVLRNAVVRSTGETVFIVGPSGAGKSTFLHRFFERTLSPEVRAQCVVIDVNALDATGDEATALSWMTAHAIKSIEAQLFTRGYPEWPELQGLYHLEYIKRSVGVDALLYQRSKEEFREKFAGWVEEQVEKDREGYLRRLLHDIVKNRKLLPVFIIDNTDETTLSYKTILFQYFQAIRRSIEHCLLLFPVTDRSAWTFSKTEIFNIYASKSFFLPTPPPREVFRKRIDYLKGKLSSGTSQQGEEYLAGRGIRVRIGDLGAFAAVVEHVFVEQDYAANRVGELSNYNVRKALDLSKRIITSSVFNVDDLVRSYLSRQIVATSPARLMNALLKGDYEFYKPGDEPLIFPVFQVDSAVKQSPLVHVRVLALLHDLHTAAAEDIERHLSVSSILAYFGNMAMGEVAVQRSLEALLASGLIAPYDPSKKEYSSDHQVAITESGLAHLDMAVYNPVFFEQMALTTRIPDPEVAAEIRGIHAERLPLTTRLGMVRERFCRFLVEEDGRHCMLPESPEYRAQRELGAELERQWTSGNTGRDLAPIEEFAAEGVQGTVERFDHTRGYGFVDIPSLKDSVFLHANVLEQSGVEDVYDGDDLICDVRRTQRGLMVSRVSEVRRPDGPVYNAIVSKIFADRGYGFVYVAETGVDAFFHSHLLSNDEWDEIYEGQELQVEVKTDREGRSQVRRIVSGVSV